MSWILTACQFVTMCIFTKFPNLVIVVTPFATIILFMRGNPLS
nr:MAG TPA: hypothetical protein [Caudoviricetes sp.]